MRAHILARGRVVQKGIGEPHVLLLTRASWVEPSGSVYCLCFRCYALCMVPIQLYIFPIEVPLLEEYCCAPSRAKFKACTPTMFLAFLAQQ